MTSHDGPGEHAVGRVVALRLGFVLAATSVSAANTQHQDVSHSIGKAELVGGGGTYRHNASPTFRCSYRSLYQQQDLQSDCVRK